MKRCIITVMMVLLALSLCFAESYNGFEVKRGYGDVDVIMLEIDGAKLTNEKGTVLFEVPLAYYKAIEKQLKELDKYMTFSDDQIRTANMDNMDNILKNLRSIFKLKEDCLTEKDIECYENWENGLWESYDSEDEQISKKADEYSERFNKYDAAVQNGVKKVGEYIGMKYIGFGNNMDLSKNEKKELQMLIEAFPTITLKGLL